MTWDMLVRGGTVIDPAQGLHRAADVAVLRGKIVEVGAGLDRALAATVVDATDRIVTPGFVDLHAHTFASRSDMFLEADSTCLAAGATTVLDAGSATPGQFPHYWETDVQDARTRTLALVRMPDPYGPDATEWPEAVDVIRRYDDVLIGVKYHHSQHYPSLPLAREAADFAGGILMAEAYGAPLPHLLEYLNPGDLLTHTFHAAFRFPLFDHRGMVLPAVRDAVERGVYLDVGHGSRGFAFRTVEQAIQQGVLPSTISTDLHGGNVDGPVLDMPTTMSKFLAIGLSLEQVIEMSTATPAKALHREGEIGTLKPGASADIVVSRLETGTFEFMDVLHERRTGSQRIVPDVIISRGEVYDGARYEPGKMTHAISAPPGFSRDT